MIFITGIILFNGSFTEKKYNEEAEIQAQDLNPGLEQILNYSNLDGIHPFSNISFEAGFFSCNFHVQFFGMNNES